MLQFETKADESGTEPAGEVTVDAHAPIESPDEASAAPERWRSERRKLVALAMVAYVLVRVESILMSGPFETSDTASYVSNQNVRPPLGAFLLDHIGHYPYVVLTAFVSTLGYLAVAYRLWDRRHPRLTGVLIGALVATSFIPAFHLFEHWLIPDGMLTGLSLIAVALAWPRTAPRWRTPALMAVLVMMTLLKEIGFAVAVMVLLVMAIRWSWRTALAGIVLVGLLFTTLVGPASNRPGRVLYQQPMDTPLTMNRFRVLLAGMYWTDIDPALASVKSSAAECGMTSDQLLAEIFGLSDKVVDFKGCQPLWDAIDSIDQADLLLMHARNPEFVMESVRNGFTPDMNRYLLFGGYSLDNDTWLEINKYLAGAVALVPLLAVGLTLARRRGRRLALVSLAGTALALSAILVDPSAQDRHAAPFRLVAFVIALFAIREALGVTDDVGPDDDPTGQSTSDATEVGDAIEQPADGSAAAV